MIDSLSQVFMVSLKEVHCSSEKLGSSSTLPSLLSSNSSWSSGKSTRLSLFTRMFILAFKNNKQIEKKATQS